MAQELTVVVTGSTGKQGGAVARSLLERGHKVRAVTRDPNSSQARLLASAIHRKTDAIEPFVHPGGILAHAWRMTSSGTW
jgi:nucleoside-diphosphate-sugar epimerase